MTTEINSSDSTNDFIVLGTAAFFAVVSWAVYYWILYPVLFKRTRDGVAVGNAQQGGSNQPRNGATAQGNNVTTGTTAAARTHNYHQLESQNSSEILAMLAQNGTFPPHVATATTLSATTSSSQQQQQQQQPLPPAHLLSNGLVAFRHTHAVLYESNNLSTAQVESNRRDRARVLSRILSLEQPTPTAASAAAATTSQQQQQQKAPSRLSPPLRGGTFVVSVPEKDVDCDKLRRILYLLGTFYNLLLVVVVDEPTSSSTTTPITTNAAGGATALKSSPAEVAKLVEKVRGTDPAALPEEVLPSHRVILVSSVVGRVALVRQLTRVELVLEFDAQVQTHLQRFGFKVLLYGHSQQQEQQTGNQQSPPSGVSLLGSLLLT